LTSPDRAPVVFESSSMVASSSSTAPISPSVVLSTVAEFAFSESGNSLVWTDDGFESPVTLVRIQ